MLKVYLDMLKGFGKLKKEATVVLYGSVAKGISRTDSDIDIAIITDSKRAREKAEKVADGILFEYGKVVSLIHLTPRKLYENRGYPFIQEILKGNVLYGRRDVTKGNGGRRNSSSQGKARGRQNTTGQRDAG
ncbi:MAG: nucleotidyltransferase domain-containing protein [Candidatus Aenigmarchaeota archaeon]|nr:nucleotidyltransferase domain-containing protein [Candidatus Aenigmarchaeota archaeon]